MNQLTGKIFWVDDDFKYMDIRTNDYDHVVARIEKIIIDDNMITFFIPASTYLYCDYSVNLLREETGTEYEGTFINSEDNNYKVDITCEKFNNEKKYFLYGSWRENEVDYTWWAIINKS